MLFAALYFGIECIFICSLRSLFQFNKIKMNFKLLKAFRLFSVISFSFAFLLDFHGSFSLLFRIFFFLLFTKANQQSLAFQSLFKFRLSTTTSKSADDNEHHACQYPCYCYFGITFVCVYMHGQNGIGIQ